jgi:16S rRNA (guanine527-N7)-methyltransferase
MSGDFQHIIQSLYPDISSARLWQLNRYVNLLQEYNQRLNLISRADMPQIWEHHILPSLMGADVVRFGAADLVMDLGSGAGLPGIPLKIIRPEIKLVLVDSSRKKIAFLQKVIYDLQLASARTVLARLPREAERYHLNNNFHCVLARAVSSFRDLCEIAQQVLLPGGYLLAWKGEADVAELHEISGKMELDFTVHRISTGSLPAPSRAGLVSGSPKIMSGKSNKKRPYGARFILNLNNSRIIRFLP